MLEAHLGISPQPEKINYPITNAKEAVLAEQPLY